MSGNEWSQARAYVRMLREKGHADEDIRQMALERGWTEEQVEKLLPGRVLRAPPPPPAQPSPRPAGREVVAPPAARAETESKAGRKRWGLADAVIPALLGLLVVGALGVVGQLYTREKARDASCLSNMKELSLGVLMYCQDHHERMPDADKWQEQTRQCVKHEGVYHCPLGGTYAMNDRLSGRSLGEICRTGDPAKTILFYEVDNEGGRLYDVHHGGANYAYVTANVVWREKSR